MTRKLFRITAFAALASLIGVNSSICQAECYVLVDKTCSGTTPNGECYTAGCTQVSTTGGASIYICAQLMGYYVDTTKTYKDVEIATAGQTGRDMTQTNYGSSTYCVQATQCTNFNLVCTFGCVDGAYSNYGSPKFGKSFSPYSAWCLGY